MERAERLPIIPDRVARVEPFLVMDVLDRAKELERQGRRVIHLEIGEPDFDTPEKIRQAGMEALRAGETHYTHSMGIFELRQAVSDWYRRHYGVRVDPDQVLITMGTSPGLLLVLSVLLGPGDEVILANPGYACYPNFIRYLGAVPVFINVGEEENFQLTAARVREHLSPRVKAILINSPANPTGTLLTPAAMKELAHLGVSIISDEIYHGLVYSERAHSILEFTENAFVLNGFSKLFAMTGWRLGYVIAPAQYVRTLQKLQQNFFISPASFVQRAGVVALTQDHPELEEMRRIYDRRRREMIQLLRGAGFGIGISVEPTGAFYVFANARRFHTSSLEFAFELLENTGVAVAPGIDFGTNGEGYLRFSYANSLENIRVGIRRIAEYLERRQSR